MSVAAPPNILEELRRVGASDAAKPAEEPDFIERVDLMAVAVYGPDMPYKQALMGLPPVPGAWSAKWVIEAEASYHTWVAQVRFASGRVDERRGPISDEFAYRVLFAGHIVHLHLYLSR